MSKAYSSNLTQAQWELLAPLIPSAKPGGRPREVDVWEVLNAIFYVLCQGCTLANLPGDFPNWQTVYTSDRNWRKDGTWVSIHDRLRAWTRVDNDRHPSPSEAIVDSLHRGNSNNGQSSGWVRCCSRRLKGANDI